MKEKLFPELSVSDRWVAGVLSVVIVAMGFLLNNAMARRNAQALAQGKTNKVDTRPMNHLAGSLSPYLLAHAHNPVDWYPWGDEALAKAKKENRPIFLSVGYSACHWCHVMEKEDFENAEIAKILNANFVCIKVDREERPDIDDQYQLAVQLITQQGGWPMSVWLTPDLKPFYAGTYYPEPNFRALLERIATLWKEEPAKVRAGADQVSGKMQEATDSLAQKATEAVPDTVVAKAVTALLAEADTKHGGFGTKPKFPEAPRLMLLLDQYRRTHQAQILTLLTQTLDAMACGGIYDQLGGGFHRYSTDEKWLRPHFEKMLYDQAQLAMVYLDAYEITQKPLYRRVAQGTLDYVLRDMTDPNTGGFYSTVDADSEGQEGKYYVWSPFEIRAALGERDGDLFAAKYGVGANGNFEDDRSVLHLAHPLTEAEEAQMTPLRERLRLAREKRVPPAIDDKVVAAWNGLMIGALAEGYRVTGDKRYQAAAVRASTFVERTLTRPDGTLLRAARNGQAGTVEGFLDDYAFMAYGNLLLNAASGDAHWLQRADQEAQQMNSRFWDRSGAGGFVSNGPKGAPVAQRREGEDNATPSPNGIAAQDLIRLAAASPSQAAGVIGSAYRRQQAAQTIQGFQSLLRRAPVAFPSLLIAYSQLHADLTSHPLP